MFRWAPAALIFVCLPAYAGTDDDDFEVTTTVVDACTVTADDLDFGDYDPTAGSPDDATTTLYVTCTNGSGYTVALDPGGGATATVAAREMDDGSSNILTYGLYRNAARNQVWGETAGVDTLAGTGTGAQQTLTVYGRIPAGQTAPAGDYDDLVTVTVTF